MASIVAIRNGLAANLATIDGLRATAHMPDRVSVPAAIVTLEGAEYDNGSDKGFDIFTLAVRVYVSKAEPRSSQDTLDAYLSAGDKDVKTAIERDRTLAGACHTLDVAGLSGYGVYEIGGVEYLGVNVTVVVYARVTS